MLTFFFTTMQKLLANTNNQTLRLTLDEARQFLPQYTHYLLELIHEENSSVGNSKYQVPVVLNENSRITELRVSTIALLLTGTYRYNVYGQNSSTNLDPANASVVGIAESGWLVLTDSEAYYTIPDITLDNDVIYNG